MITTEVFLTYKTGNYHEQGVSEVVGLMLLVATVVILSAFIAGVAFGLIGTHTASKNVGINVDPGNLENGNPSAMIIIHGGIDLVRLTILEYSFSGGQDWYYVTDTAGNELDPASDYPLEVGQVLATGSDDPNGKHLILRGTFTDGTKQVLFDKRF